MKTDILKKVIVHSPAKLNLTFDVVSKRPDGYHDITTIYQAIDLEDRITLELEQSEKLQVLIRSSGCPYTPMFPTDDSNLIFKAVRLFVSAVGFQQKIKVTAFVEKQIPIGAGLAGGSANAAGALVGLNHAFGLPLEKEQVLNLASQLGADVPFCLEGGTQVGRGKGDGFTRLEAVPKMVFLLIKPRNISTSTAEIYSAFDRFFDEHQNAIVRPDLTQSMLALATGDLLLASRSFHNVFETVVFKMYPRLQTIKEQVIELGAFSCNMTGSGPTLFALVANHTMAHHIRRNMQSKVETSPQLFQGICPIDYWIVESIQHGAKIKEERKSSR